MLAIYQQLKESGYTDDHIVLIVEDDIARNPSNPNNGVDQGHPNGDNVYEGAKIDYRTSSLRLKDIADILTGEKSDYLPEVIEASENDNYIYLLERTRNARSNVLE